MVKKLIHSSRSPTGWLSPSASLLAALVILIILVYSTSTAATTTHTAFDRIVSDIMFTK